MPIYSYGNKVRDIYSNGNKVKSVYSYGQLVHGAYVPPPPEKNYILRSTGTQWIDTGWVPQSRNIKIEVKYQQVEALQPDKGVIGTYQNTGGGFAIGGGSNYANKLYLWGPANRLLAGASAPVMTTVQTATAEYLGASNIKTLTINGITTTSSFMETLAQMQWLNVSAKLFCNGETTRADRRIIADLYHCKIWDNGILVRDFVPIALGSTKFSPIPAPSHCSWEAVSGAYFPNAGTGNFSIIEY